MTSTMLRENPNAGNPHAHRRLFCMGTALAVFGVATAVVAADAVPWVFSGSTNRVPVTAAVVSTGATTVRTKLANEAVASTTSIVMDSLRVGMLIIVK